MTSGELVNHLSGELSKLKEDLQLCFLDPGAQQLINRLLDSSPECTLRNRLSAEKSVSLCELAKFAPMAAIQTFLPFAREKNLKEITAREVILAFAAKHPQAIWEIIKNKEGLQKLLIQPSAEEDEVLLLFLHSLNLAQIESFTEEMVSAVVNFGQQEIRLIGLSAHSQLVGDIEEGDFVIIHCGWVIEKIDKELAEEIRKIQEEIRLGDGELLLQLYSRLPSCVNIQTVFNGFFSERHRLYKDQKHE